MSKKCYVVIHDYDVDGGMGNAICEEDLVAIFQSEDAAKKFADRWAKPHVYDDPYAELFCGKLRVEEWNIYDDADDTRPERPWWLVQ